MRIAKALVMTQREADSTAREIKEIVLTNTKDRIFGIKFDVSKSSEVDYYLIKSTIEKFKSIDVLVNKLTELSI